MARQEREIRERFRQGVIMLHAGEYDYAVTAFRRVLQLSPDMPEAHVNMGFAQFGQGHHTVARDFFLSAIDLKPDQANAYWGLAVSLEALCDLAGARGAMRSYIHLSDPEDRFVRRAGAALMEWEAAGMQDAQGCISASGSGSVSPMGRNLK
jgi:Flp pilus assembly protein TadD